MKITTEGATIQFSREEIEALYEILKGPNTADAWHTKGCTTKQVGIGVEIHALLHHYLGKSTEE